MLRAGLALAPLLAACGPGPTDAAASAVLDVYEVQGPGATSPVQDQNIRVRCDVGQLVKRKWSGEVAPLKAKQFRSRVLLWADEDQAATVHTTPQLENRLRIQSAIDDAPEDRARARVGL